MRKTCLICGKDIGEDRGRRAVTCSPECGAENNRRKARQNKVLVNRGCSVCGAEIDRRIFRARKTCLACQLKLARTDEKVEVTLTQEERRNCVKFMMLLNHAVEVMHGATPCIDYPSLMEAWKEYKPRPLVIVERGLV